MPCLYKTRARAVAKSDRVVLRDPPASLLAGEQKRKPTSSRLESFSRAVYRSATSSVNRLCNSPVTSRWRT